MPPLSLRRRRRPVSNGELHGVLRPRMRERRAVRPDRLRDDVVAPIGKLGEDLRHAPRVRRGRCPASPERRGAPSLTTVA